MSKTIEFEQALEDDDWGLIISSEGKLKGLFIPDGKEEDQVPREIVAMCKTYFGIDVKEEPAETIH
mgnify:CR=1 FL=1|tara:strand:- start:112 stop:309 length:198 start_codon:yes stop_codon:yes gene_type:complete